MNIITIIPSNIEITVALISAGTTIFLFILTGIGRFFYTRYSLNYKLKKEYNFEQRKSIKVNLARSKTPLIKAAEELNYRLWNLSDNINEGWLNVDKANWTETKRYYLRSTVYRFLTFIFWTLEAERSIYSFDFSQADKSDTLYLKYIKVLKHFFCAPELLKELGYDPSHPTNHFYKDDLQRYACYIKDGRGGVINFMEFERKFQAEHKDIEQVIRYMTKIDNTSGNLNYNVVRGFHLFLMLFLNKYGLDYHYTQHKKYRGLIHGKYSSITIKKGLYEFFERNKVMDEAKWIIKDLLCVNRFLAIRGHIVT